MPIVLLSARRVIHTFSQENVFIGDATKLKRLLEVERRNLRAVRAAHAKDLQSRTELEALLRACVDDVRKERAVDECERLELRVQTPGRCRVVRRTARRPEGAMVQERPRRREQEVGLTHRGTVRDGVLVAHEGGRHGWRYLGRSPGGLCGVVAGELGRDGQQSV